MTIEPRRAPIEDAGGDRIPAKKVLIRALGFLCAVDRQRERLKGRKPTAAVLVRRRDGLPWPGPM